MRELALHLLDILENAVRAKATVIQISILLDKREETLTLICEDDGPGFATEVEKALDPFYTTKQGKRTGLGLSLFRGAAQQAGGDLVIEISELGGIKVVASFVYHHLDRAPLGDVAASICALVLPNPEIVWIVHVAGPTVDQTVIFQDILLEFPEKTLPQSIELFAEKIRSALQASGIACT